MAATLSDVARHAGVSTATASRALNDRRYVSAAARAYIDFALSREVQERWCDALGAMPVHRDALAPRLLAEHPRLPNGPDDHGGILHVPESLKLEHELTWTRRFEAL